MRVISLGWGCQSFALAAMSALGELPPVDAAIHADTTHERAETYEFAERWTPWLEERGVKVVTVSDEYAARQMVDNRTGQTHAPMFTLGIDGGKGEGQLRRSCTGRWKIAPIRRWVSSELQQHGIRKTSSIVEQWLGITLDEVQRMKPSNVKYIKVYYPFIETFNPPMRRWHVIQWLQNNGLEVPVRSSCIICPYHDRATWQEIKRSNNGDWEKAVTIDEAIRQKRPGYKCYVSHQRKPLPECDFSSQRDHGQLGLWDEECEGYCFL